MKIRHNNKTYETNEPCCGGPACGTDHAPDCQAIRDIERQIELDEEEDYNECPCCGGDIEDGDVGRARAHVRYHEALLRRAEEGYDASAEGARRLSVAKGELVEAQAILNELVE